MPLLSPASSGNVARSSLTPMRILLSTLRSKNRVPHVWPGPHALAAQSRRRKVSAAASSGTCPTDASPHCDRRPSGRTCQLLPISSFFSESLHASILPSLSDPRWVGAPMFLGFCAHHLQSITPMALVHLRVSLPDVGKPRQSAHQQLADRAGL